jgi:uncharacterized protein (DUF924 family)
MRAWPSSAPEENMKSRLLLTTMIAIAAAAATAEPLRPYEGDMNPLPDTLQLIPSSRAVDVIEFWVQAGPELWFAKDAEFDRRFRDRFLADHEAASRGELQHWQATPLGALALVILLDQFPRNAFRGSPRMYDTDAMARKVAHNALAAGYDRVIQEDLCRFLVLPFAHSEDLADQERAVALARRLGAQDLARAMHHRDIVRRFGRFPHRNHILGRESTSEERRYLENGGYQG